MCSLPWSLFALGDDISAVENALTWLKVVGEEIKIALVGPDVLKKIKRPQLSRDSPFLAIGAKVWHKTHGVGTVVKTPPGDDRLFVKFENDGTGMKKQQAR